MSNNTIALAIGLVLSADAALAAEEAVILPVIQAQGQQAPQALTALSVDQARIELEQVPGGTTLIDEQQFRDGFTRSLEEALSFAPGVYAKSRFGSDEVRLSIRGSGITQTFNMRGVRLLRDGLPLTEADGNVRPQLIEPLTARYIEVYRGANALEYGAATLGGAINLVSPTAYTYADYPTRIEFGSHKYLRFQASNGRVFDNGLDVYGSATGISQDGFREQSQQETLRFYANGGRRWNSDNETRFHLNVQDNNIELPGSLTEAQLKDDPTQANAGSKNRNSQRDFNLYRTTAQHTVLLKNGGRADFGVSYQYLEMYHPLSFALLESDQNDASVSARVQRNVDWGSRRHSIAYGALASWGNSDDKRSRYAGPSGDNKGARILDGDSKAWGGELFAQDTLPLRADLDLILGAQLAFAHRESSETPSSSGVTSDRDDDYTGVSPRAGLLWQARPNAQIFANISRSFEPPTNGEFFETLGSGDEVTLDAQTATTFELGTRGQLGGVNYELALYYAKVSDEILFQEDPSTPGLSKTLNADDTIHRGVEFGISGNLTHAISVNAAYTYNNFEFDNDDTYGDNEIPGIPPHLFNAELIYHFTSGFYLGPTLEAASSWEVDFANSRDADSYAIVGAKTGYQASKDFRIFAELVNLTDKTYASNTSVIADAGGSDASVYNPGLERSVFVGLELRL